MAEFILAVGGVEEGVGRTLVATNLAAALALGGQTTALVGQADASEDLGSPLRDLSTGEASGLAAGLCPTSEPRLWRLTVDLRSPTSKAAITRLFAAFRRLPVRAVVLDLSPGELAPALFARATARLLVLSPRLLAPHRAASAIRATMLAWLGRFLRPDLRPLLEAGPADSPLEAVLWRLASCDPAEATRARAALRRERLALLGNLVQTGREERSLGALARRLEADLAIETALLGALPADPAIGRSNGVPLVLQAGPSRAAEILRRAARLLLEAPRVRRFRRVPVGLPVVLEVSGHRYPGEIVDLAAGGARVEFSQAVDATPAVGTLRLNGDAKLAIRVQERHRVADGLTLGFAFEGLSPLARKAVSRLVVGVTQ